MEQKRRGDGGKGGWRNRKKRYMERDSRIKKDEERETERNWRTRENQTTI